jgi:Protein of unknown function (DUF3592)
MAEVAHFVIWWRTMEKTKAPYWAVLVAVVVLIAAISVEFFTVGMFLKAKHVEKWPTSKGVILHSELSSQFHGSTTYEARIDYEYSVGDKKYISSQVRTRGTSTKHRSDVAPLVDKFPVGREVLVYYNPADPTEAYLETGVDFVNYIIIVSPLLFAFGAGAFLVEWFRGRHHSKPNGNSALK